MRQLTILMLSIMVGETVFAISSEQFLASSPEEKIQILRGKPEKVFDDSSKILQIYTASLSDSSLEVRKTAALASALLVSGLQEAKAGGNTPAFSENDSSAFQQALLRSLTSDEPSIRKFSTFAIANSAQPHPTIEKLLLDRLEVESLPEVRVAVVEAMVQSGYTSPQLASTGIALMQPHVDSDVIDAASNALARLRPQSALDMLVALASKASPSQRYALLALAAYGQTASRAVPTLGRLIVDQTMPEEMRNLAKVTLEAIQTGKPQPSNLEAVKAVNLWPVKFSASTVPPEPAPLAATPASAPPVQTATPAPSSPITPAAESSAPVVERTPPVWPWVVGILALVVIVAVALKRRA